MNPWHEGPRTLSSTTKTETLPTRKHVEGLNKDGDGDDEDESDVTRPSPLTRRLVISSPRRLARRRGYGWYDLVKNDAKRAAQTLNALSVRRETLAQISSSLSEISSASSSSAAAQIETYRPPPRPMQRAMAFYTSAKERQRFLEARPKTALWEHQRRGADFIHQRESEGNPDGGIIAYKMRSGKTLMIVAAILEELQQHVKNGGQRFGAPTLFVAPTQALKTIAGQIAEHFGPPDQCPLNTIVISSAHPFVPQSMTWDQELVGTYDLIITSYSLIAASYRRRNLLQQRSLAEPSMGEDDDDIDAAIPSSSSSEAKRRTLLDLKYRRIVADEAHVFCNTENQLFSAMMSLEARYRWYVTGTPMRNSMNDLLSPLKFLRTTEAEEKSPFRFDDESFRRLLDRIILRNPHLHNRALGKESQASSDDENIDDMVVSLKFATPVEADLYHRVQHLTRKQLRGLTKRSKVPNKLHWILRLRQICVDPYLVALSNAEDVIHHGFEFVEYGTKARTVESFIQDSETLRTLAPKETAVRLVSQDPRKELVDRLPQNELQLVISRVVPTVSTKVRYILWYYEQFIEHTDEKLIVFSQWAGFLERLSHLFEERTRLHGQERPQSSHLLVHGKVERREELFHTFRTDATKKMLLLTIGTGGVSLDLSCANHVILPDPWFNPFTEEQAIARVLGPNQSRRVRVIRLYIKGTIDEQILKLADSKRDLSSFLEKSPQEIASKENMSNSDPDADSEATKTSLLVAWLLGEQHKNTTTTTTTTTTVGKSRKRKRSWEDNE